MVNQHFKTIEVAEKEVVTFFIYLAKSTKSFDSTSTIDNTDSADGASSDSSQSI